jgi:hypothetical protein
MDFARRQAAVGQLEPRARPTIAGGKVHETRADVMRCQTLDSASDGVVGVPVWERSEPADGVDQGGTVPRPLRFCVQRR